MTSALARYEIRVADLRRAISDPSTYDTVSAWVEWTELEAAGPPTEIAGAEIVVDDARAVLVRAQAARLAAVIARVTAEHQADAECELQLVDSVREAVAAGFVSENALDGISCLQQAMVVYGEPAIAEQLEQVHALISTTPESEERS